MRLREFASEVKSGLSSPAQKSGRAEKNIFGPAFFS
jgi:hypothetical protein